MGLSTYNGIMDQKLETLSQEYKDIIANEDHISKFSREKFVKTSKTEKKIDLTGVFFTHG